MSTSRVQTAAALMQRFAERTGLASDRPPRRYLWTDAFAVANELGLARATGDPRHLERALRLVGQVHDTLGRHRPDDARRGWISGLPEEEGARHPTRGGLRIGKPLPERAAGAPLEERLEWERDGQYFHYLTRWMQALDLTCRATGDARLGIQAGELALAATRGFVRRTPGGALRMVWKMSIDLSRPLVSSMGQHDPLDGHLTCLQVARTLARLERRRAAPGGPGPGHASADDARARSPLPVDAAALEDAARTFARIGRSERLLTTDPLGLGSLLLDAWRADGLLREAAPLAPQRLEDLLSAARAGLAEVAAAGACAGPAEQRLPFREIGLAIGLAAVERLAQAWGEAGLPPGVGASAPAQLAAVRELAPLGDEIEAFWLDTGHQRAATWTSHEDINAVMLATRLVPDGLRLVGPTEGP